MELKKYITTFIYVGEERGYVAECQEISVVAQGESLDKVVRNLSEAVALHLEGENLADFALGLNPILILK